MYKLVESFSKSKKINGNDRINEDSILDNKYYGVISDGATTLKGAIIDGLSPGKIASTLVVNYFKEADSHITFEKAINDLEKIFQDWYKEHKDVFNDRITTSSVILNKERNELWFLGDCSAKVDNKLYCFNKEIDNLSTSLRVFTILTKIKNGETTYEECLKDDVGRDAIIPIINKQVQFQNSNDGSKYAYGVLDGYPTLKIDIHIIKLDDNVDSIILTSDGYPKIEDTLERTELTLKSILEEDPLMIGEYATTKGLTSLNSSFDDRSYLRYKSIN
jgi:glycerophosphoryl diester phosphodiesterase